MNILIDLTLAKRHYLNTAEFHQDNVVQDSLKENDFFFLEINITSAIQELAANTISIGKVFDIEYNWDFPSISFENPSSF